MTRGNLQKIKARTNNKSIRAPSKLFAASRTSQIDILLFGADEFKAKKGESANIPATRSKSYQGQRIPPRSLTHSVHTRQKQTLPDAQFAE